MAKPPKPIRLADMSQTELLSVVSVLLRQCIFCDVTQRIREGYAAALSAQIAAADAKYQEARDSASARLSAMRRANEIRASHPLDTRINANLDAAMDAYLRASRVEDRAYRRLEALWREERDCWDREVIL